MVSRVPYATSPDPCVLVINTGGTFGMKKEDGAYSPVSHTDLLECLKQSRIFGRYKGDDRFTIDQVDGDPPVTVSYKVVSLEELLDSSNMSPCDWNQVAERIRVNYSQYIGFVVIHGTDTMVYTASALSFMLENQGKPVVITGAQIPIFEARSDARDNLINSVIIAGRGAINSKTTTKIPEVLLCFGKDVYRGNRCIKIDSSGFNAFISPNHPPLVELGVSMKVNFHALEKEQRNNGCPLMVCKMPDDCEVGILRLYPGITEGKVREALKGKKGVVLQSFGAGNAPDKDWFKTPLKEFVTKEGGIIVNVTQCPKGTVTSAYECGKMLKDDCEVVAGGDMTEEAAFCKLCYLFAKKFPKDEIKKKLKHPLRGEMAEPESDEN